MARTRKGFAFQRRGKWCWRIVLRDKRSWQREVPAREDGKPITKVYAEAFAEEKQRAYDAGEWDPQGAAATPSNAAPGLPAAPPPGPAPLPTVLEHARTWIATQTYATVKDDSRRIERYLPEMPIAAMVLDKVQPRDVLEFVRALQLRSSRRGGLLAPRSVLNIYDVVRRALAHALFVYPERLLRNPCDLLPPKSLPEIEDKDPEARAGWHFSIREIETIISAEVIPEVRRVLWAVLFLAGPRISEAAALRWRIFEPDHEPLGLLQVVWQIERVTRAFKTTKMKRPRKVPVHPTLAAILAEWKLSGWQRHMGRPPGPDDLILPGPGGRPWSLLTALKRFYKDLDVVGLRRRHVHCTRRTFISRARDAGGRGEILRWITHGPSKKEMVDGYSSLEWSTFCAEVIKLRVERRRSAVLYMATGTSSGAPRASTEDSVTDSVTTGVVPVEIPGEVGYRGRGLNPYALTDAGF